MASGCAIPGEIRECVGVSVHAEPQTHQPHTTPKASYWGTESGSLSIPQEMDALVLVGVQGVRHTANYNSYWIWRIHNAIGTLLDSLALPLRFPAFCRCLTPCSRPPRKVSLDPQTPGIANSALYLSQVEIANINWMESDASYGKTSWIRHTVEYIECFGLHRDAFLPYSLPSLLAFFPPSFPPISLSKLPSFSYRFNCWKAASFHSSFFI